MYVHKFKYEASLAAYSNNLEAISLLKPTFRRCERKILYFWSMSFSESQIKVQDIDNEEDWVRAEKMFISNLEGKKND